MSLVMRSVYSKRYQLLLSKAYTAGLWRRLGFECCFRASCFVVGCVPIRLFGTGHLLYSLLLILCNLLHNSAFFQYINPLFNSVVSYPYQPPAQVWHG
ncbi:hypothetical protein G7K_5261-t1 [Saitoella complicata NRRL Y-17804]|uniref:Uncharacterized protein n=1 Tax=Saitoella complicata (strain BCRC 22490 / CBS 7301 / JCM 7358 / NBRC 10748 / NRRL Y-17804) TaxID=698492 RepID=A0A0E9NNZ4_SAICN|nr:hypothetical protein G7K_5261-t1 [Saitoella complicata NRRL Y-17804]